MIEFGMPFPIQWLMACNTSFKQRALEAGGSLKKALDMVRLFRERNNFTPVILMGHYNPIYSFGVQSF